MHTTGRRASAFLAGIVFAATLASSAAGVAPSYTGELESMHGDAFSAGHSVNNRLLLKTADRKYLLAFDGRGPQDLVGQRVTVRGSVNSSKISVSSLELAAAGGTGSKGTGTSTTVASTTKNVAVLLFNFQNDTRQPYTPAFASGVMFSNAASVANYFAEESFGQYAVSGAVFGWYTIPYDNTGCSYSTWATAARAAATAAGVALGSYSNFVYAFPSASGCGWSGLAYLPGTETWNNNSMSLRTNAHELSHNFGVHHASTISCTESGVRVALSSNSANCSLSEYGDPFTVMGAAQTRQSHAEHKAQMTWVPTGERLDVTAAGTYTVGVDEQSSASPKVVRVARAGATNQYFYLDFRQPFGSYFDNFSSSDPAVTGVTIRVAPDYSTRSQSWLVDTTPGTASYGDAPLAVGQTFSDPLSRVTITTINVSATAATVSISLTGGGPSVDTQVPTAPTNLVATGSGSMTMALSWSAATDNVGVAGYRVSRNGSQVATTSGTSWNDAGLTPATTYAYSLVAYDAAGNVSTAATASGTTAPDTQAPTSPILTVTVNSRKQTNVSWTASTDNVQVTGYRVYQNGLLVSTTTKKSYNPRRVSGTFTYYVVAFDAAGNVSLPSNSVTVTVP
jgi:chitodextrinase